MDGVKVGFGNIGMTVEAAGQYTKDRKECSAMVHMYMIEFNAAIIAWPCVLLDRPSAIWCIITWRGVGYHYMMWLG